MDEWKIDQVHIWPFIRVKLFFAFVAQSEKSHNEQRVKEAPIPKVKNKRFLASKLDRVKNSSRYLRFEANRKLKKLPKSDYLVATSFTHRTDYSGDSYNKFADPLLDTLAGGVNLETSLNHLYDREKVRRSKRVYYFYDFFNAVLKSDERRARLTQKKVIELEGYESFLDEVTKVLQEDLTSVGIAQDSLLKTMDRFHDFVDTYDLILDRIKPKRIFSVCFYTFSIMALNYAAKRRGIETIEIQHGPQSDVHMGYASWTKVPGEGYNTIPQYFWNWDKYSYRVIKEWTDKQSHHKCFIGGNPWFQYLNPGNGEKDIILYSLQNLNFEHLFPTYIIDAIKLSAYKWWIRLHPRQLEYLDDVIAFFKENGIYDKVNIEEATNQPLPNVLSRTKVHITNFSGCTLEAAASGIPSVVIDSRGRDAFMDLIKEGQVIFCEDSLQFKNELNNLVSKDHEDVESFNYNWEEILSKIDGH